MNSFSNIPFVYKLYTFSIKSQNFTEKEIYNDTRENIS